MFSPVIQTCVSNGWALTLTDEKVCVRSLVCVFVYSNSTRLIVLTVVTYREL